jgi:hypothetical protein
MYIPRTPRPFDFCGCPPCPICFVLGDDGGNEIADGMIVFFKEILQADRIPTPEEKKALEEAAQRIHVANMNRHKLLDEELRAADTEQHTKRRVEDLLRAARREVKSAMKPLNTNVLDGRDLNFVLQQAEQQRIQKVMTIEMKLTPEFVYGSRDDFMQPPVTEAKTQPSRAAAQREVEKQYREYMDRKVAELRMRKMARAPMRG